MRHGWTLVPDPEPPSHLPPHTIPLGHPLYIKAVNFFLSILLSAAAKSRQSCLTLCDHIDGSPPGSSVPEILEARTLEWVAISFSNAWKWRVKVKSLSCLTQRPHGLQPTRLLCPWDFPGKSTGVGCHCLLHYCLLLHWIILMLCEFCRGHSGIS